MTTATTTIKRQGMRYAGLSLFSAALAGLAAVLVIVPDFVIRDAAGASDEWLRFSAAALLALAISVIASLRNAGGPATMSVIAVVFAALSTAALVWSRIDDNDTLETWFFVVYIAVMVVIAGLVAFGARAELIAIAVEAAPAATAPAEPAPAAAVPVEAAPVEAAPVEADAAGDSQSEA